MKRKQAMRILACLTAAVMVMGTAAGCGSKAADTKEAVPSEKEAASEESGTTEESLEEKADGLKDMSGRDITLEEPVEKVVALTAADCEILYAIGAGDLLVGRGEYCNYPEEVMDVESVSSGSDTNIEQILALEPDVLFMAEMDQTEEQINALEQAGISVVVSNAQNIEETYTAIDMIGKVVDKEENAQKVIDEMKDTFEDVKERAQGDGSETVYFEVSPLEYGLWTAGSGTFMDELAQMLGLKNIFSDVEGWAEISEEQVLERDPDYIFTVAMYMGEGPTPQEEILGRAGWENISAIQNQKVFLADNDEFSRPGPRLADAAVALCDSIYGEE